MGYVKNKVDEIYIYRTKWKKKKSSNGFNFNPVQIKPREWDKKEQQNLFD